MKGSRSVRGRRTLGGYKEGDDIKKNLYEG